MKQKASLISCFSVFTTLQAQADVAKIPGTWQLQSVTLKNPAGFKEEGIRSMHGLDDLDASVKDRQLQLLEDNKAQDCYSNTHRKNQDESTWSAKEQTVLDVQYNNGQRTMKENKVTVLKLVEASGMETRTYLVVEATKQQLTLKGEVRNKGNATAEALLVYKRKRATRAKTSA